MDVLTQGIPLGRWFGTHVTVSFSHIVMLLILSSSVSDHGAGVIAVMAAVYFLSILLHEFGHAAACKAMGGTADQIVMGPMGGLTMARPPDRPLPHFITTAGGPAVNAILFGVFWFLCNNDAVPKYLAGHAALGKLGLYFLYFMAGINRILLVLNILPIFPLDGGRLLQHILWPIIGFPQSLLVTGMIGTAGGAALIVVGLGVPLDIPFLNSVINGRSSDIFLLIIGITCAFDSFGLYRRAQEVIAARRN